MSFLKKYRKLNLTATTQDQDNMPQMVTHLWKWKDTCIQSAGGTIPGTPRCSETMRYMRSIICQYMMIMALRRRPRATSKKPSSTEKGCFCMRKRMMKRVAMASRHSASNTDVEI